MLVLRRKPGEVIHIGDNITIRVQYIRGRTVSIAIEAPRDVPILRPECDIQPPMTTRPIWEDPVSN